MKEAGLRFAGVWGDTGTSWCHGGAIYWLMDFLLSSLPFIHINRELISFLALLVSLWVFVVAAAISLFVFRHDLI